MSSLLLLLPQGERAFSVSVLCFFSLLHSGLVLLTRKSSLLNMSTDDRRIDRLDKEKERLEEKVDRAQDRNEARADRADDRLAAKTERTEEHKAVAEEKRGQSRRARKQSGRQAGEEQGCGRGQIQQGHRPCGRQSSRRTLNSEYNEAVVLTSRPFPNGIKDMVCNEALFNFR